MRVMQELVAVSVLNVTAPNTHTMPTSCSQIWGNLIFQLLGNKLRSYVSQTCLFFVRDIQQ